MKKILLMFMLFCGVCYGAESVSVVPVFQSVSSQHSENKATGTIHVTLMVSVPASNFAKQNSVETFKGATTSSLLESMYTVEYGKVCTDLRGVKAINGLAVDPVTDKWWWVTVNGNIQNSSARTKLVDGDVVEWIYKENYFYKPNHVTLDEWAKSLDKK